MRAGSVSGFSGAINNVAGSSARFSKPTDLVIDLTGNIYVADAGNNCIRKITPFIGLQPQSVSTFAGTMGTSGYLDSDTTGRLALFNNPVGLAIDYAGNLYVSDNGNHCIRKITPTGFVSLLAGSGTGNPLAYGSIDSVGGYASFKFPAGLGWYSNTELLVADMGNAKIRKVNILTGRVTTVAGTGATGSTDGDAKTQATFNNPSDVVMDTNQNIYVTESYSNLIRKITGTCVSTFAGSIVNSGNTSITTDTANGIGVNARFMNPTGITFSKGALFVADNGNNSIRKISVAGTKPDAVPVAKFSIIPTGATNTTYNLIDSTAGNYFTGLRWKITPSSFSYVGGTDSSSVQAQVKFNVKATYTITLTDINCWGKNSKTLSININNAGINEVNADKFISVYPNPTNGVFEIAINTIDANTIRVMDINGKVILERKVLSTKETIDMTGFAKGVYVLNISGTEISLNKKLIIE
jgi:sugar lactone lactonase YvrE